MSGPAAVADDAARAPVGRRPHWALFGGLAVGVVLADQATKLWVDGAFPLASIHGPVPGLAAPTQVLGDLVRIAKSYNDGGLFGLFDAGAPLLALASLGVIGLLVYMQARAGSAGSVLSTITLGLLLGGALGNLIDRIRLGSVIDFVDMGVGDLRWYTYNVADAAISLAIVGLLLTALGPRRPRADDGAR